VFRARDGGQGIRRRSMSAIALVAFAWAVPHASAQDLDPAGLVPVAQDPAQVREYWTAERMRDAIPIDSLGAISPRAKAGSTAAKPVKHPSQKPYRSHGKVFFTLDTDYVCSGTALRSPAGTVVWTAGHCTYGSTGLLSTGYASNWEFVPAYKHGHAPFGEWPKTSLRTTPQWKASSDGCTALEACGDVAHDFGAANVAKLGGKTLQQRVGGRGISFNGPRDRTYKPIGFPQEPPFDGETMQFCKSAYQGADSGQGNPAPMRIHCDMTGGSSGGGWIAGGKVASVVSYGYGTEPNNLYGPYQGSSAQALFNQVK
jgi:V8-like Glu-specific endopeptidase